ncbi:MAG: B12-binding domain-containing radical SAM protein [Deltaproteobacteria bacterium]|nr:B12-binding domain-containing radical SAM protein [Deltaproteobacteria bacterium]
MSDELKIFRAAPLTHSLLAAYTPPDIDVSIVDEAFEPIDFDMEADIIATTCVVPLAPRAYEVARAFRIRRKTVVCGGPHASLLPNVAAAYFDAVVIGEGDMAWPQLLSDFRKGRLKKFYKNNCDINVANIPFSRRDLLNPEGYSILNTVQATRGCPFSCQFCTTRTVYSKFSTLPVGNVVKEIEQVDGNPFQRRVILFWDDNLIGNPVWAKKLFQEMIPLKKIWFGQLTFNFTHYRELVELASKSGCRGLFLGLESFNSHSLNNCGKRHNIVNYYKTGIKLLHDNGIAVYAGIMFGFDDDRKDVFERTLEKTMELGIDMVAPRIVVPYPNTPLFMKLNKENRIIHTDWSKYNGSYAVFHPKHMTADELERGFNRFNREFHSYRSITKRLWKSRTFPWLSVPINLSKHKALQAHPDDELSNPAPSPHQHRIP